MLDVVKVEPVENYILLVEFENGERRKMDMSVLMHEKPFSLLVDERLFGAATVRHGSVAWNNQLDIAPETLYALSTAIN